MKTISLRFGEHFSPECGTIASHEKILNEIGYVWYGKMGAVVSKKVIEDILKNESPKILLIRSGQAERYWAHIQEIKCEVPNKEAIPDYYRNEAENFKTWFKVTEFEIAPKDVMSKCTVASSGKPLGEASKHSMSPYFIINYEE